MLSRKKQKGKLISGLIYKFTIGPLVFFIALSLGAQAQVLLVPLAPKQSKPSSKNRNRPKKVGKGTTAPSANPASLPLEEEKLEGTDAPQVMGFPIVKPAMSEMEMPKPAGLSESGRAPAAEVPVSQPQNMVESPVPAAVTPEIKTEPKPTASETPALPPGETAATKTVDTETIPTPDSRITTAVRANTIRSDKLLSYSFNVTLTDTRGKVSTSGTGARRYLAEELPGGTKLEMVEVIGGSFMMGRSAAEIGDSEKLFLRDLGKQTKDRVMDRLPAEGPQHAVTVGGFFIGKFEITQSQWRAVASLPKVKRDLMSDPSQFKDGNLPVENVSWEEAVEFCERLSRASGRKYRLPTEAEWEYACRGGSDTPFHFGQTLTSEVANFDAKRPFLTSPSGENRMKTVTTGSLGAPNAFGIYDMHGNVWEWCADNWHEGYQSAPSDGSAWVKGGIPYLKVLRGGAWDSAAVECRSGFRDRLTPTLKMSNIGLRVVLEAVVEP